MKIKTMYATFGKLDEARLDLSEGMNVLCGANESGKSTWSAFLRVMLYGISTREKSKIGFLADKEKYAPWSGKPMYGRIELSWRGKEYLLERKAGKNGILQDAKITDALTGNVLEIPEPVGETLLGIRREVFERTAFIAQAQLAVSGDKTGELEKKICALATTGEEDVSQKQVIERLEKQKRTLQYYKKGEIPELEEEIYQINETINVTRDETGYLTKLHMEMEQLKQRELYAASNLEKAKVLEARRNLNYIKTAENELNIAIEQLDEHKEKETVTQTQLEEIQNKYKQFEEKDKNYTDCCERLRAEKEKGIQQDVPEIKTGKILATAFVAGGVILGALLFVSWIIAAIAGAVAFAAVFFIGVKSLYKKLGIRDKKDLAAKKDEYFRRQQTIVILEEDCKRLLQERNNAESALASVLKMLGRPYSISNVEAIFAEAKEYEKEEKRLTQQQETLSAKYQAMLVGRNLEELVKLAKQEVSGESLSASEEELISMREESRKERELRAKQAAALTERINSRGELGALETRLREKSDLLQEKKKDLEAVNLAIETLTSIQNELARKFAPTVEKRAGEIFEYLTGEHFKVVRIEDAEMNIQVAENEAAPPRSLLELSGGTLDELYIAVRLALCEALLEKQVPILLDDALVNFDDKRAERMVKFLEKLSKERQILVFTCHSREARLINADNATCVYM